MTRQRTLRSRFDRRNAPSLRRQSRRTPDGERLPENAILDCGWGRLIFAHTFEDPHVVAQSLDEEEPGRRDIAFYVHEPHVALSHAPQRVFLDPSHTYRLWLTQYRPARKAPRGFTVRPLRTSDDIAAINRIYAKHQMVQVPESFMESQRTSKTIGYLVAEDEATGEVIGTVTGIDHVEAFGDPEKGASLWCLAVDPQAPYPGIGEVLVRNLAERFQTRGRAFLDLSVMHDNTQAIALYDKLGFQRIPIFALKTKTRINEDLFMAPTQEEDLNPYAQIVVDEARRRGITVKVIDAQSGLFRLTLGGRSVVCREALSALTSSVAMTCCDDKGLTHRLLARANLQVPAQQAAGTPERNRAFLARHKAVVVKPLRGEQGRGVSVDLRTPDEVEMAVEAARRYCEDVILEAYASGQDLRIIVIDEKVVAAAVRRPARITGTGRHRIAELIETQSRRRAAATNGESAIPVDSETRRCVEQAGYGLEDTLPEGVELVVRKTANLHTGGTIHDVTADLHPVLAEAAVEAARTLNIPVVGFDFIVPAVDGPDYVIIEANERPGLANHEPAPTAQAFVDLLFPKSAPERLDARIEAAA